MSLTTGPRVPLRSPDRFFIGGDWVKPCSDAPRTTARCHTLSYAALIGAAAFTSWYPVQVRRTARSTGPDEPAKPASPAA